MTESIAQGFIRSRRSIHYKIIVQIPDCFCLKINVFHPDLGSYVKSEYFVNPDLGRPKDDLFVSPDAVLHILWLDLAGSKLVSLVCTLLNNR